MADEVNDGGPAFPVSRETALSPITDMGGNDVSSGMSLRDWFAGQALVIMPYLCANDTAAQGGHYPTYVAGQCYDLADAMLTERAKRGQA